MKIEMTERDKKLIVITAFILIIVVPLWFVIKPALAKGTELKAELESLDMQKTQMENEILKYFNSVNDYKTNVELFNEESAVLNPIMENNQVDKMITDLVTGCGMKIKSLSISNSMAANKIEPYKYSELAAAEEENNTSSDSEGDNPIIYSTNVSLSLEGSSDNMYKLIDAISAKSPGITALFYSPTVNNDGSVSLSTTLTVYMVKSVE